MGTRSREGRPGSCREIGREVSESYPIKKELASRVERLTNSKLSLTAAEAATDRPLGRWRRRGRRLFFLGRRLFLSRFLLSSVGRLLSGRGLLGGRRLSRGFLRHRRAGFGLVGIGASADEARGQQDGE